jgi:hypothetical protein
MYKIVEMKKSECKEIRRWLKGNEKVNESRRKERFSF